MHKYVILLIKICYTNPVLAGLVERFNVTFPRLKDGFDSRIPLHIRRTSQYPGGENETLLGIMYDTNGFYPDFMTMLVLNMVYFVTNVSKKSTRKTTRVVRTKES